jgi:hypothetical protein
LVEHDVFDYEWTEEIVEAAVESLHFNFVKLLKVLENDLDRHRLANIENQFLISLKPFHTPNSFLLFKVR